MSTSTAHGSSNGGAPGESPPAAVSLAQMAGRMIAAIAQEAQRRVPTADLDERDPDYIRETLPGLWMLASLYFRAEVRGLHNIPEEGPVLLVGNHSGGTLIADTFAFAYAFYTHFGPERRFYQLAHDLAGRTGFIELALARGVPLVPVVAIGGQETALFLTRGERLARALGIDRLFRLKVMPVSLGLPWGVNVGDLLGHLPLPAKITVEALPPIDLRRRYGPDPDVGAVYDDVVATMQAGLDRLAAERRIPLVG